MTDFSNRKIIQIATTSQALEKDVDGSRDSAKELVVAALCDDGSAWMIRPDVHQAQWERLPKIPQD